MTRLSALHDVDRAVDVVADGTTLAQYVYVPTDVQLESPRPYLHPVRTRGGDLVTAFRPHDHVWHKGIAWSLPVVGEHNFWGGPTYVHGQEYVQLENDGSMDHVALHLADGGPGSRGPGAHPRVAHAGRRARDRRAARSRVRRRRRATPGC